MALQDEQNAADFISQGTHTLTLDTVWTGRFAYPIPEHDRHEVADIGRRLIESLTSTSQNAHAAVTIAGLAEPILAENTDQMALLSAVLPGLVTEPGALRELAGRAESVLHRYGREEVRDLEAKVRQLAEPGGSVTGDLRLFIRAAIAIAVGAAIIAGGIVAGAVLGPPIVAYGMYAAGAALIGPGAAVLITNGMA